MSKLRLNGTSSGYVEIAAPATGANNTITLPSTTGSVVVQGTSGITSFTSGPVFVGSGTSTGTASQTLQVTGGAYVSGDVGLGVTNPSAVSGAGQGTGVKAEINGSLYLYEGGNTSNHGGGIGFGVATFPSYTPMAQIKGLLVNAPGTEHQGDLAFYTRLSGSAGQTLTERARFTNTGYFKAANNGSYISTGFAWHEFNQWANDTNVAFLSRDTGNTATCFRLACSRTQSSSYFFATFESNGLGNDNEFTFRGDGVAAADGSFSGGGADYAEYFEWEDGNPDDEDRRGYSVSLIGNKIKIAEEGEQIIGVISANPSVVGDSAWNKWSGKYLTDDFGSYIFEDHNVVEWTDEDGKEHSYEDWNLPEDVVVPEDAVIKTHDEKGNRFVHRKVNPEYNPNQEYIPREERPEWDAVGMMGKLRLRKGQLTGPNWIKLKDISATVEEWLVR